MKKIIVTGAGGPAGVNFINSLRASKEKFHIIGLDTNPFHLEWAKADEKYIIPYANSPKYKSALISIIKKTRADFLHPQPDNEVATIGKLRKQLPIKTLLPSNRTIEICQDKHQSAQIWKKAGFPIEDTILVKTKASLISAAKKYGYPYWLRATHGASSRGSTPVTNLKTAEHWIGYWKSRGIDWEFVAQAMLPGKIIAFQSVWYNGNLITSQARERVEYLYPSLAPSGVTNTPTIARTVNRDDVNEAAQQAVRAIDKAATGIYCVDLREDKNGRPIPTEINCGRFFTTSFFFTKAGVNMPYIYVKLAFNETTPKVKQLNAVPEEWYWCRHIDCPGVLVKKPSYATKETSYI